MSADLSEELMKSLMLKLYKTITGSDSNIKIPISKYVSWFMPGIPFEPEEFRFCQIGFTSRAPTSSTPAEPTSPTPPHECCARN